MLLNPKLLAIRTKLLNSVRAEIEVAKSKNPHGASAFRLAGIQGNVELAILALFKEEAKEHAPAVLNQSLAIVQCAADVVNGGNEKALIELVTTIAKFIFQKNNEVAK